MNILTSEIGFRNTVKGNDVDVRHLKEYFGTPEDHYFDYNGEMDVEFVIEPEYKSWGVKGISICVKRVHGAIEWTCYAEELEENEKAFVGNKGTLYPGDFYGGSIEIDSACGWEIKSELLFADDGYMTVTEVEIDHKTKTITVS
jgi:hypothetical protein